MDTILKPYQSGFLDVGDGHKIYYELCGNPQGKPILYVHGGPGAGFSESSKKWFDPKLWNIILFDQRGAGHSTPFASLEHNTTDDLVSDINKLLHHINIEKVTLFGGSWGSTLSLVYAIRNRERINGMILRGIFLPSKKDNEYYLGGQVSTYFPEVWQRFISIVPKEKRGNILSFYFDKMRSGKPVEKKLYTYEWAFYEASLLSLKTSPKKIVKDMEEFSYQSLAPLEAYYLQNNCFLPENYILHKAHLIADIPTFLIHGRFDMICQPINAWKLHKQLPNSKLFFTVAGHASSDKENKKKLLWAVKKMYSLI